MYWSAPLCTLQFCDLSFYSTGSLKKIYCTWPWNLATKLLYSPLKSPVGADVHKTTYGPLIDTALYVMLLMRANPLPGQVGEGWLWKS
jgi:hypothetical protein